MKAFIVVLVLAGVVWCGPYSHQRHNSFGAQAPPYLRNVTMDARREFFRILSTTNETIAEQAQHVLAWGEKYGVQAQVEDYNAHMTTIKSEMKQNTTDLINSLLPALEQLSTVVDNEDQTRIAQFEAVTELAMKNPQAYSVLQFMMTQLNPMQGRPHQSRHRGQGSGAGQQGASSGGYGMAGGYGSFGQGGYDSMQDMSVDGSPSNGMTGEEGDFGQGETNGRGGAVGYGSFGQGGASGSGRSGGYDSLGQGGATGREESFVQGGRSGAEGTNNVRSRGNGMNAESVRQSGSTATQGVNTSGRGKTRVSGDARHGGSNRSQDLNGSKFNGTAGESDGFGEGVAIRSPGDKSHGGNKKGGSEGKRGSGGHKEKKDRSASDEDQEENEY